MSPHAHRTFGTVIGIGLVSGAMVCGASSLTASYASNIPSPTAMPVAAAPPTNGITEVAKQVTPAVVNITTVMTEKVSDGFALPHELRDKMEESFGKPFGPYGRGRSDPVEHRGLRRGQGSIFLRMVYLDQHHVIAKAREVNVTLPNKREFKGRTIGTDPKTNLAVTSD